MLGWCWTSLHDWSSISYKNLNGQFKKNMLWHASRIAFQRFLLSIEVISTSPIREEFTLALYVTNIWLSHSPANHKVMARRLQLRHIPLLHYASLKNDWSLSLPKSDAWHVSLWRGAQRRIREIYPEAKDCESQWPVVLANYKNSQHGFQGFSHNVSHESREKIRESLAWTTAVAIVEMVSVFADQTGYWSIKVELTPFQPL